MRGSYGPKDGRVCQKMGISRLIQSKQRSVCGILVWDGLDEGGGGAPGSIDIGPTTQGKGGGGAPFSPSLSPSISLTLAPYLIPHSPPPVSLQIYLHPLR
jgi:hypothetical protein